jgi:hypothetical protein
MTDARTFRTPSSRDPSRGRDAIRTLGFGRGAVFSDCEWTVTEPRMNKTLQARSETKYLLNPDTPLTNPSPRVTPLLGSSRIDRAHLHPIFSCRL